MIKIQGITINEEVSQGYRSVLYRGCDNHSAPVLIKAYKIKGTSYSQIAQFKQEFHNIFNLKSEGIVKAKNVEFCGSDIAIVLEDFKGIFLNDFISNGCCEIQKFIDISTQLAAAVGDMHNAGIIHKELKPKSILINQVSGRVKIIDFGLSSVLTGEYEQIYIPEILLNSLTYISPEQTGRMNRTVDYRTDFYSLGIILYELLTGTIPFSSNNPLELFHSHIARTPKTPGQHRTDIPEMISEIIMKLLSKNPEDRYHSGHGLMSDLEECRAQIENRGWIEPFEIGKDDVSDRLIIPQKIYGREDQIGKLMTSFERVSSGRSELMLVTGYSGVGKTVLINEIHKPIVEHRGVFLWGKFDQFGMNMPYSALIQAFQGLIRQLLTESEERITIWKKLLSEALGNNGKIITEVIPEVELLTGRQPDVPGLGSNEAQTRFNIVFQDFVRVFPNADHPVVIFLDDLQWVDSASLGLIRTLIADSSIEYILFIGAFRDNEVTPSHRLKLWLDDIEEAGIEYNQLFLRPLNLESVNLLAADTLKCSPDAVNSLSKLIYQKTEGNPFFVKQFLMMLCNEGMLTFSAWTGWQWDIDSIKEMEATDNVVDLMIKKIQRLPEAPLNLLRTASCFGSRFYLEALAESYGKSIDETYADLSVLLENGLVMFIQTGYKFSHDRIWETTYSLVLNEERKKLHYKIGKMLLQRTKAEEIHEKVFDIVNQLNFCIEFIADKKEQVDLARLNLTAGRRAKAFAAYESAAQYFQKGTALLTRDSWESEYDLTLGLYTEYVEALYLTGDHWQAEKIFDAVLENAKSPLDRTRVYEILIDSYTVTNRRREAIRLGIEALESLGFDMPEKADLRIIEEEMTALEHNIGQKKIEDLLYLPELTDPDKLAAVRILMSCTAACYSTAPEYLVVIALKLVNLSLRYGNSSYSAYAYIAYGVILCGRLGDIERGFRFGELSIRVLHKFKARELWAKVYYIFGDMINHWKRHYREDIKYLEEAIKIGPETGDLAYTSYSINHHIITYFLVGGSLGELKERLFRYYDVMKKYKQLNTIQEYELWYQLVINLTEHVDDKLLFRGDFFDEEETIIKWEKSNYLTAIGHYTIAKQFVLNLYGAYEESIETARSGEKCIDTMTGMNLVPEYHFYYSLALLAYYSNASNDEQIEYLKIVEANQEKMKKWAEHAPDNFLHKYLLVEAELSRAQGEMKPAVTLFDRAIELAGQNGFIQDEAIANERAALFYFSVEMEKIARIYMQEAHSGYKRWGAVIKVTDLENEYPYLLAESGVEGVFVTDEQLQKFPQSDASIMLDYSSIIDALQAIFSEIVLENLLDKLMRIVFESSGANRGLGILNKDGKFFIEIEMIVSDKEALIIKPVPVDERDDLLMPVVNYVKRSLDFVVLDDASNEGDYIFDPYVATSKQKSIFCLPIIRQTELVGILYLENNIAAGAFTKNRVEVLKLLAAQAAISLKNAMLVDGMKKAEMELKESEEKFRSLVEYATDMIIHVDMAGIIQFINNPPSGLAREDIIGKNVLNFSSEKYYRKVQEAHRKVLESGVPESYESVGKVTGNWYSTIVSPIKKDSEVIALTLVARDVTRRKKAEEELSRYRDHLEELVEERTADLRALNKEMEAFSYSVSHDLRAPLRHIDGFIRLLEKKIGSDLDEKSRHYIETIVDSSGKMGQLIDDLLSFSRISRVEIRKKTIDLNNIIDEIIEETRTELKDRKINWEIEKLPDIEGDRGLMKVVMANLISNAVKFTNQKDKAKISVGSIRGEKDETVIFIRDNGAGFDMKYSDKLFGVFQRLHGEDEFEGTGIGLATVQRVINRHGGKIWAESEKNKGAVFYFSL